MPAPNAPINLRAGQPLFWGCDEQGPRMARRIVEPAGRERRSFRCRGVGAPLRQAPATLSRQQVNPAQQIQETHRRRPPDVFSGPIKEPCRLSELTGARVRLQAGGRAQDDARILSERDRQFALGDLVGKHITPHQLCEIRDRLAQRVFRHWVLARVIIPPQVAAAGLVKFQILPAKIVSVRFDGDDIGPAQTVVENYLSHLQHRSAFNLDEVQKWLLLVNDIPGISAVAKIVHSGAPGAPPEGLDMIVTLRRMPIDESAMVANTNSATLGPWTRPRARGFQRLHAPGRTHLSGGLRHAGKFPPGCVPDPGAGAAGR